MFSLRGLVAVIVAGALLAVPISYYWQYLTKGMRPPETTQILNQMEKTGFPNFTLPTLDGKPVSVTDFKGKILLVNIWATWCAPCVKEIPSLKNLVNKFGGKLVVLAVSHDRSKEDIETFVKAFGGLPEDFIIVWDKDRMTSKLLGTDALPETYILKPNQELKRKIAGETAWDDSLAIQFFDDILNPPPPKN
ncbi:MAG: TlpA family protein disulfide reductase [Bdellovibrionales bacterium]|nr:TlpA family protein disulfide reductase [Bdellovibrionales bacterium]